MEKTLNWDAPLQKNQMLTETIMDACHLLAATRVYGLLVQLGLENKIYTNTKLVKKRNKKIINNEKKHDQCVS